LLEEQFLDLVRVLTEEAAGKALKLRKLLDLVQLILLSQLLLKELLLVQQGVLVVGTIFLEVWVHQ